MRVVVLGSGNSASSTRYSTSVALEHDGQWLLVDCPHPLRRMLADARPGAPDLPDSDGFLGVVVTHAHADHCGGLEGVGFLNFFERGTRTHLVAHPRVLDDLWEGHLRVSMSPPIKPGAPLSESSTFFTTTPLDLETELELGPFSIGSRLTRHPVTTTGLRISAGAGGARVTVALSADTDEDPEHLEWLSDADLVLHEAGGVIHTPVATLEAAPAALRSRLRLLHYPDTITDSSTPLVLAHDGDVIEVVPTR